MSPHQEPEPSPTPVLGLVHEGWQHLQLQRPLAAWASWQRALRFEPENAAALKAIATLKATAELPAAARAVYRFRTPPDDARRSRWDDRLRAGGLDELDPAAGAFAALTRDDPDDADAWYNLGLCHAWLGRNVEAVASLDRVVVLLATADPDRAAAAWLLAEVLRLGAGAETLADDFRYALALDAPPAHLVDAWPNLLPVAVPPDPVAGQPRVAEARVFEWLDRPPADLTPVPVRVTDLPRVLGALIHTPSRLRLSSPDPSGFAALDDPEYSGVRHALGAARREKTPLPIAWADSAVATFRIPAGLDDATRADLARAVVEHFFENLWVHVPRQALGDLSPMEAARASANGDAVTRARLTAVVGFREQLGARPTHAAVYQGYPFDRLRRRLGLVPSGEGAVDADDFSCASEPELDHADPSALDDTRLADAFTSAAALRSDARAARFAAELIRRDPPALSGLDPFSLFSPLVREALRAGDADAALSWLERGRATFPGPPARTFTVWSAEVLARHGRPDAALAAYQGLLGPNHADAALALDGAETLLDNGYPEQALPLLIEARTRARASADEATLTAAERLFGTAGG